MKEKYRQQVEKKVTPVQADQQSSVQWSSYDSTFSRPGPKSEAEDKAHADALNRAANKLGGLSPENDVGIWRKAQASTHQNTYAQHAITSLRESMQNRHFISIDTENIGSFDPKNNHGKLGFYAPTEVALTHMYRTNKGSAKVVSGSVLGGRYGQFNSLSLMLNPGAENLSKMQNLVRSLQTAGGINVKLSEDERRSLQDLILYSDSASIRKEVINGLDVTTVLRQARDRQLIGHAELIRKSTIQKMQEGLTNLSRATSAENAAVLIGEFIGDVHNRVGQTAHLVGHNIQNFDRPAILSWLEGRIGKDNPNSKIMSALNIVRNAGFVDTLQVERTLRKNPGVLNKNLTLSELASVRGLLNKKGAFIQPGQAAHFGAYDTEIGGRVYASHISDFQRIITRNKNKTEILADSRWASWDENHLRSRDKLFSLSGISGRDTGKFDMVLNLTGNGYVPAYTMKNASALYRNATYKVHGFYNGVQLDDTDQRYYGALLHNQDRNTYHFIARNSMEDLQHVFHKHLAYVADSPLHGDGMYRWDRAHYAAFSKQDAAMRRWNKIFSTDEGGGVNLLNRMRKAHEAYTNYKGPRDEKSLKPVIMKAGGYTFNGEEHMASESFYRDFLTLKDRFAAELPYINQFTELMQKNSGLENDKNAQNVALRHFKMGMDGAFGTNQRDIQAHTAYRSVYRLNVDGQSHYLNVSNDLDGTQQSLAGIIGSGHIRKDISPSVLRTRLKNVLGELRATDIVTGRQAKRIRKMIEGIQDDNRGWYVMQEMAFRINQARQRSLNKGEIFGLKTISVETPTKVINERAKALEAGFGEKGLQVMKHAIEQGSAYHQHAYDGMVIRPDSVLSKMLDHHEAVIDRIVDKLGISGTRIARPQSAKEMINNMLKQYIKGDMRASLYSGVGKNNLMMAIYHRDHESQVISSRPQDLMANNHVVTVNIPMITEQGELSLGAANRIARPKLISTPSGFQLGTAFDDMVTSLTRLSGTIETKIQTKGAIHTESFARGVLRHEIENLSVNNSRRYMRDGQDIFAVRKSKSANWQRMRQIDLHDLSQSWFESVYGQDETERVRRKVRNGMDFYDAMGQHGIKDPRTGKNMNLQMQFQENLSTFARTFGIDVNAHSTKDTLVAQNVRSYGNVSELYSFGYFNQMARENMMKSVNYAPLEEKSVGNRLRGQGFKAADIDRMIKRGVVTDEAYRELAGETNFLSVRSAYMNSQEVFDRFQDPHLSTHEGMFVLRSDVAKAYGNYVTKEIKLSTGAKLDDRVEKLLLGAINNQQQLGMESFDYTKSFVLDTGVNLFQDGIGRQGGTGRRQKAVTIGVMAKEGILSGKPVDFYEDPQNQVTIRGYDAEKRALILDKWQELQNGDKMLTTRGDRVTVSVRTKAEFAKAGLNPDVEAILPEFELNKRMYGTYIDSAVQLAYDQMRRKTGPSNLTMGKIALADGLETLQQLMNTHLQTNGKLKIVGDQITIASTHGLNENITYGYKQVHEFLAEAEKAFGGDLTGRGHLLGQVGIARADQPNWEDRLGLVNDGSFGKVRWGLKEVDVIQSRLNRMSAKGIETNAVSTWLHSAVQGAIAEQSPEARRLANAYARIMLATEHRGNVQMGNLKAGDVVIRTHAERGEFGLGNENGTGYAAVDAKGVVHVSAQSFQQLPEKSSKGQVLTMGDYQKTILTMHQSELPVGEANSNLKLKDVLARNHGTALLEMPEGMNQKYMRLVSQDLEQVNGMAVMSVTQQKEAQIWRYLNQYNEGADVKGLDLSETKQSLQKSVDEYHTHVTHMFDSARSQSLSKTLMSAKMDMSGRFKIQGINPTKAATKGYEDATAYVSRAAMADMINGTEHQIAQTLFNPEEYNAIKGHKNFNNKVLDKIGEEGLYGFVGRYPTIAEDTIQVMKVKIDKRLKNTYQGALMTVGTAVKLKADYDGDFLSAVLSHYKIDDKNGFLSDIHKQLGDIWSDDKERIGKYYDEKVLPDVNGQFSALPEVQALAQKRKVTVQDLMRDPAYREEMLTTLNDTHGKWRVQTGGVYDLETEQARLGKQSIGFVDNTRQKLLNLANATYDILGEAGHYTASELVDKKALIEDFGRNLSQEYISSKKFNVEDIRSNLANDFGREATEEEVGSVIQRRRLALTEFMGGLLNPTADGVESMKRANSHLGLYKDQAVFEKQLDAVKELRKLNGSSSSFLYNRNMHHGVSEGSSLEEVLKFLHGNGNEAVMTPWVQNLVGNLDNEGESGEVKNAILRSLDMHKTHVLSAATGGGINSTTFAGMDAGRALGQEMLGDTVASRTGAKWRDLTSQISGSFKMKGGANGFSTIKMAAVIFGSVWAGDVIGAKTPTPESLRQDLTMGDNPTNAPAPPSIIPGPTARVAMNGEAVHMRVSAKGNMSPQEVSALIHSEMSQSMPMPLNMNMNVKDNTQNIDKQWLQGIMTNALTFGHAFSS